MLIVALKRYIVSWPRLEPSTGRYCCTLVFLGLVPFESGVVLYNLSLRKLPKIIKVRFAESDPTAMKPFRNYAK